MQTSYDGDTLAIEGTLPKGGRAGHYALQAAALPAPSPRAESAMRIVTPTFGPRQQVTWTIVLVPGQWQPTAPSRRKGFGPWYDKLKQLAQLTDGWDSYSAPAPRSAAIDSAELYLSALELLGWPPTRLEASAMGGVGITHRSGVRKVYVEFYNDGRVHALFSDRTLAGITTLAVDATLASYHGFIAKAREYLHA